MLIIEYCEDYTDVLRLLDDAKEIYCILSQRYTTEILLIEFSTLLNYKVTIELKQDAELRKG